MSIQVEVWGEYACFSRPELKTERMSYDVMTPSAARGLLESIYFHPGMCWKIDRIHVINPIRFTNIRRNEVSEVISANNVRSAMNGGGKPLFLNTSDCIQQRASLVLRDVRYVIDAHFDMVPERAHPGDNPGKFQDIIKRRLSRGECYSMPYFGCREFSARFRRWPGGPVPCALPEDQKNRDLGLILYDFDYTDSQDLQPIFFRAALRAGVLETADCEVFR